MAQVAPVNLPYNIKTLWFDPKGMELSAGQHVVVSTQRGLELGQMAADLMEVDETQIEALKSPLKPVERVATEDDIAQAQKMQDLGREAMPIFKQMAAETSEQMHPVSVEYLLDGSKAVFYFESEERVDFRDLVKKLASHFHVRVDMRQIGVRDEARIVGGLAHCGQEVCCKRLGGEFNPVSIRMAKDQDLSLNPQKISGLCGRLMCCLRYESETYKEFKKKAPKVGSMVSTPAGTAKVIELDIPKETVRLKVEDEKPVRIPLSGFAPAEGDGRPDTVTDEAWEAATQMQAMGSGALDALFEIPEFTGSEKLGEAKAVHHEKPVSKERRRRVQDGTVGKGGKGRNKGSGSKHEDDDSASTRARQPRRRSTKITGGQRQTKSFQEANDQSSGSGKPANGKQKHPASKGQQGGKGPRNKAKVRPGQRSSSLSQGRSASADAKGSEASRSHSKDQRKPNNRRRRKRKASTKPEGGAE